MTDIIIKTQADLDALPDTFQEFTQIIIQNDPAQGAIQISKTYDNASVYAYINSSVHAFGNSSVQAYDNSSVQAYDNSSVYAYSNSSVCAYGNSSVHASGYSSVRAFGNSSVQASGNSSVLASGNSSVGAWDKAGVRLYSSFAQVSLYGWSVCWMLAKGKVSKKSTTAIIIEPAPIVGTESWLDSQGIESEEQQVILFKRVSSDFKTQEGTSNETLWQPGSTLEHADWKPSDNECGEGKFHACSQAFFCDQFRSSKDDKYVALQVHVKDLYAWPKPTYLHKIAFRKATVLYQCDKLGKQI